MHFTMTSKSIYFLEKEIKYDNENRHNFFFFTTSKISIHKHNPQSFHSHDASKQAVCDKKKRQVYKK